jgi:hypothetical protein
MTRPDAPTMILEFTPGMRVLIEDAIEALILLLDEIDGDADLEGEPDDEDNGDREDDDEREPDAGVLFL